ncbi:MAG: hypothetical protein ACODAA_07805, partial [Gemmatimonadota bacterium]
AYRNEFQSRMEISGAAFADGIWFSAGVDARRLAGRAPDFLAPAAVDEALAGAVEIGSPIDFDAYPERYADEPRWLHVAGSLASLQERIRTGVPAAISRVGVPMPPRGGVRLTNDQLRAVAVYVWTLSRRDGG